MMGGVQPRGGLCLENHMVAVIKENLALCLYDNAIFLAERLLAEFYSEPNVFLLATCHHRAGQNYRAYHLLKGLKTAQCRYLFATCCVAMGKLVEAEGALLPDNDISRIPNGAAGYYLLGRVFHLSNRHSVAIAYYNTALKLDPMMWCAFEALCVLGADVEAREYISAQGATPYPAAAEVAPGTAGGAAPGTAEFTFDTHTPAAGGAGPSGAGPSGAGPSGSGTVTPPAAPGGGRGLWSWKGLTVEPAPPSRPPPGSGDDFTTPEASDWPSGPPALPQRGGAWPPSGLLTGLPTGSTPPGWQPGGASVYGVPPARKFIDEGKMRKISSKLFADPASALKSVASSGGGGGGMGGEAAELASLGAVTGNARGTKSLEGQACAVGLLQLVGEAFRLMSAYQCREAVEAFNRLPAVHLQTGWVLTQLGRAYFEQVDYGAAALAFEQARRVDPHRLAGLEVYSTVLWHMKREVELSSLAQEAVAIDRLSPATWAIMGNCFSLQKEHEAAMRFFIRAVQLDATAPYPFTLCGHEYFANEDFEKAVTCYRNAIRIDPRHYNAWFGMGHIYYRQEKYGMAEYHFRRAHTINERSSVLRCYLGMALHKLKRHGEALQVLGEACAADPRNPLARFERAGVLVSEGRLQEALRELAILHDVAPREASVLFHMGKVFKRMGRVQDALAAFSEALDLQPPSADTNLIKAAIDRVTQPDAEEEEEV